jgi:O-antigen/teichoic acid export membrane protein
MNVDSLMITALAKDGLTDTGIYTIAFFIGSVLDIPKRMINLVTQPLISEYWVEGKIKEMEDAFKETSVNGIIISSLIFAAIWINLESIYTIIPNSEIYIKGLSVVLFILIARLFEMACSIAPNIITQTRLYIYNLPLAVILIILTISLNYFLIPKYGITGAAIATMLSVIMYNILKLGLVYYMLQIQPFTKKSLRYLLLFILIMYLQTLVHFDKGGFLLLLLKNLVVFVVLAAFMVWDNTSPEVRKQINNLREMLGIKD